MTTHAVTPLLRTKLAPPPARPGLLPRTDLVGRLTTAASARLTLVCAAAGWGKTTVLREWAAAAAPAAAWVSLDPADNDPVRFWSYVIEALRGAGVPIGAPPTLPATDEDGIATLITELEDAPAPVALALDDLHVIGEPRVLEGVGFLIRHLPPGIRLGVASRTEPPLGLARMRARGELVEVRADDLRLGGAEAAAIVAAATGVELSAEAAGRLCARTEGWAAGLYLAALSLRDHPDAEAFVDAFAGDDRLVVDYLADEVLAAQPPDRRRFLLETSILSRLTGPLCDAVTGRTDGARMLAELEASNLFVVPLDTRRRWYRFHHLFGELLRHELAARDPGALPALHRRAAAWLADHDHHDDALDHLVAAGDVRAAADLVATQWNVYHGMGWVASVRRWLDLLPPEVVRADVRLCLARVWSAITLSRQDELGLWLEAARTALGEETPPAQVAASLAMATSVAHLLDGRGDDALREADRALAIETDPGSQWRAVGLLAAAMAHHQREEPEAAQAAFTESADVAERTGISIVALLAHSRLAHIAIDRGDVAAAADHARRALLHAGGEEYSHVPHAAGAHTAISRVRAREGRMEEALAAADRGVDLARRGRAAVEIAHTHLSRAWVRLEAGDRAGARRDVEEARALTIGAGRAMPAPMADEVLRLREALAVAPPRPAVPAGAEPDLTARERVVLRMLAGPASLREIAAQLGVSPNTVKSQVRAIYRKLGVDRRSRAVEAARELGLLRR